MVQRLFTIDEAAKYLSISKSSVNNLFKSGRLKRIKLNGSKKGTSNVRITEKDMEEYIQSLERI